MRIIYVERQFTNDVSQVWWLTDTNGRKKLAARALVYPLKWTVYDVIQQVTRMYECSDVCIIIQIPMEL